MPELLLELGSEELPASYVRKAYTDLQRLITEALAEAAIPFGEASSLGTPRRLIVRINDVAERQPDIEKEFRGPGLAAAYDADGKPTKALEGFCRGQGVDPSAVRKEGDYVWVTKTIQGKPTAEVLAEILPTAIRSLTFDKAMRWAGFRLRFARPIRWIVAILGGAPVQFEVEGVTAGVESRGHRFLSPKNFAVKSSDDLIQKLRANRVEPDPACREQRIREEVAKVASGVPELSDALVDENVFLTEWPAALQGEFKPEYLELPTAVLVTAMAKHEKFFPVRDKEGRLTNRFVSIRNGGEDDSVREGNAWVLNARFNDAQFFFEEDRRSTLDDFLEKTRGIVFQEKLGVVHQRAYRLTELAVEVARATGADEDESRAASKAALYAKADLSAGLVAELPSLQGLIGAEYARREGLSDPVCWAIASQYDLARNPTIDCEGARASVRLVMADQLDKLAGFLGIGLVPSGSSDPYGLRRAAALLIEAALRWPARFAGYKDLIDRARDCYIEQGFEVNPAGHALAELFRARYESVFEDSRYDLLQAALLTDYAGDLDELDPQGVRFRVKVLEQLSDDIPFIQTATRPQNILTAAVNKGIGFGFYEKLEDLIKRRLDSEKGTKLAETLLSMAKSVQAAETTEDAKALIDYLKKFETPINEFFDSTMVMAEDEAVRTARLTLLHGVNTLLRRAGDFSKIVISGD